MPVFEYTAVNASGARVEGKIVGPSEQAVLADLEARQLVPVAVVARSQRVLPWRRRVSHRRLAMTYLQLSDLLRAGVPLLRGLRLLGARRSHPGLASACRDLADAVAQGSELSQAMAQHPAVFPAVHCAMVRAGERGGFLEQVLARLGRFVMAQADLRARILGSLIYPGVLVAVGTVILACVFAFFVPAFKPVLVEHVPDLPLISRFVFAAGDALGRYGPITAGVLIIGAVALWRVSRRSGVRMRLAAWLTYAPVLGSLVRALATARFCRMTGTMLANGIPILTAMQIARQAAGNALLEQAIEQAAEAVRAGRPLAGPLGDSGLFDDDVVEMIAVGESANNLDEVLIMIADTLEARVDRMLGIALRLLEPLLLVMIAVVIGVVAAGLILPMTRLRPGL